mmetsp:Transcript_7060/g.20795  ORF Transcript_7060/g.20795 Transcript_7060/m.20795 type:complete len:274 (-) Transcript_7060:562-1383(-)
MDMHTQQPPRRKPKAFRCRKTTSAGRSRNSNSARTWPWRSRRISTCSTASSTASATARSPWPEARTERACAWLVLLRTALPVPTAADSAAACTTRALPASSRLATCPSTCPPCWRPSRPTPTPTVTATATVTPTPAATTAAAESPAPLRCGSHGCNFRRRRRCHCNSPRASLTLPRPARRRSSSSKRPSCPSRSIAWRAPTSLPTTGPSPDSNRQATASTTSPTPSQTTLAATARNPQVAETCTMSSWPRRRSWNTRRMLRNSYSSNTPCPAS